MPAGSSCPTKEETGATLACTNPHTTGACRCYINPLRTSSARYTTCTQWCSSKGLGCAAMYGDAGNTCNHKDDNVGCDFTGDSGDDDWICECNGGCVVMAYIVMAHRRRLDMRVRWRYEPCRTRGCLSKTGGRWPESVCCCRRHRRSAAAKEEMVVGQWYTSVSVAASAVITATEPLFVTPAVVVHNFHTLLFVEVVQTH